MAIFVHGCFWHRHRNCKKCTTPKTRTDFWKTKFEENVVRDRKKQAQLEALGWTVITIWECEAENGDKLDAIISELSSLLTPPPSAAQR